MNTILVVSRDNSKLEQFNKGFLAEHTIDVLDIINLETETMSIGIEDIRVMRQKLSLKPYKGKQKVAIIKDAHKLTTEAQNAFLKTLEEPPEATYILLLANSMENFLPTIISRCQVVRFDYEIQLLTEEESAFYNNMLEKLSSNVIVDRLVLAQELGDKKESVMEALEKGIIYLRVRMLDYYLKRDENNDTILNYPFIISCLQKTYNLLKMTNVNLRLAMEDLFLNL